MTVLLTTDKIASKILELVSAAEERSLSGVRLGASLRDSFPKFAFQQYQCRTLRQFIRTYVPNLVEQGTGTNIAYTLTEGPQEPAIPMVPQLNLSVDTRPWKAFTNPAHPFTLLGNPDTGELRVVPVAQTAPPPPPWVIIPKCTPEALHNIAVTFVEQLQQHQKSQLEPLLKDPKWYVSFRHWVAKAGLESQWNSFRRDHLMNMLDKTLRESGINPDKLARPEPRPFVEARSLPEPEPSTVAPAPKTIPAQQAVLRDTAKRLVSILADILNALDQ